jgi:MscS family membrane protein
MLVLLVPALWPAAAGAEAVADDLDPYPLRAPDTSSPRDTLHSFLLSTNELIQARAEVDHLTPRIAGLYLRAMETLDLSTTPHSDAWGVRTERMLMLKEILDRIELPPDGEIPGDTQVAEDDIAKWTVPDTRITIKRIEDGPRAGEFLFSADTVQRLHRMYANARHLPYQAGATAGIFEGWLDDQETKNARDARIRSRLKPVDTASPRSTLEGFLDSINRAYQLVLETDAALLARPPKMTKAEAKEAEIVAQNLLQRAIRTLDLSKVPKAVREGVGAETALQLKEIMDRMQLPPVDTVPDARMLPAARSQAGDGVLRWRYPNTEIEIVEITEGEQKGQFLFSAATVERVSDYYAQVRELPYRGGVKLINWRSPGKSEDFYDYFISTPGYMVPRIHFLGKLVENLPEGFKTVRGGQTYWQWLGLLLVSLLVVLSAWATYRVIRRWAKQLGPPAGGWLMILVPIAMALVVHLAADFIDHDLNITGDILVGLLTASKAIIVAMQAWAVFYLSKAIAETVIASPRMKEQSSEAALLRIGAGVLGALLAAWLVIAGLRSLGADLIPLLAGLGVGGLALALAAQTTIANFIGGLILFINKPVRVGEFCRYGTDPSPGWLRIGTVEEINWLSTRIRGIDRTVTNIPNAEFSKMHIVNLTQRDRRLFRTTLGLRYETTPEQMRYVLARLRELLLGHPMVSPDPARVRFIGYGAFSLDVEIFAYIRSIDNNIFLGVQEDLLLRIADIVQEAGTGFAFPSQTNYLARDSRPDAERRDKAEAEVKQWRARGKLPFPEFEEEERERMEDLIDYPPKGSPDYRSR